MGKNNKKSFAKPAAAPTYYSTTQKKNIYLPIVSVCTPTFNRRPFIPIMAECFRAQTYPRERMEWIIVDDGTDKIEDALKSACPDLMSIIKYFPIDKKMTLGAKRNFMHTKCKGSIIVYMDDDDYYPPERVEHAVVSLMENKEALCAGSSEMYIFFKFDTTINPTGKKRAMYQCGPYGPNHATAGTFAFKSRLLDDTKYEEHAALAEEKAFLKNYTVPFIQLDPLKTILVFSHNHNTFDKRKMLETPDPRFIKESTKTVDDFVKTHPKKEMIKQFFLEDIDALLADYAPGNPEMKPDVLEQTKKIEAERAKMIQMHMAQQYQQQEVQQFISIEQPGKPPIQMTQQQTVEFINMLHQEILALSQRIQQLESGSGVSGNHTGASTSSFSTVGLTKHATANAATTDQQTRREMKGPVANNSTTESTPILTTTAVKQIQEKNKSEPEIKVQM